MAQTIAKAIQMGLTTAPSTTAQWAQLANFYATPGGRETVVSGETMQLATGKVQPGTSSSAPANGSGLNAFLAAIRQHESGGDYRAYNAGGGASGAYQFIQSTWSSEATAAGYGQYATRPAGTAPPTVQDAVAAHMAEGYWGQYHTWADVAESWYTPSSVGKNVVPAPTAGNTETVTGYGRQIVQMMGQMAQQDSGSPGAGNASSIVSIAKAQLGTPYVWGGETPTDPAAAKPGGFDCSGLVQWVFKQAGVTLPRVAQTQYDSTAKLPTGAQLQPGDLLFFGSGPSGISHVGIYVGNTQMIDAPHTGADVRIETYHWGDFVGATRPTDPSGASTLASAQTPNLSQAVRAQQQSAQDYAQILAQVTTALHQAQSLYPGLAATGGYVP